VETVEMQEMAQATLAEGLAKLVWPVARFMPRVWRDILLMEIFLIQALLLLL
jgi:hypothetical protein